MEKKKYIKPMMQDVTAIQQFELLGASKIYSKGTLDDGPTTSSSGHARSRDFEWEDENNEVLDW